jgi:Mg2+-importing ATPase
VLCTDNTGTLTAGTMTLHAADVGISVDRAVDVALGTLFLPFLPLAAKQILLNNFLSDLPSVAISTDRVDAARVATPQRWQMRELRRYLLVFGLLSTAFDLLTFWLLLRVFDAGEARFQTAWFVVSLLTELVVVLVLRTRGALWQSRPSPLLVASTLAVGVLALAIPYLPPLQALFGFVPLPAPLLLVLLAVVAAYLVVTEAVKRRLGAA